MLGIFLRIAGVLFTKCCPAFYKLQACNFSTAAKSLQQPLGKRNIFADVFTWICRHIPFKS
jgi:hypothetical protein